MGCYKVEDEKCYMVCRCGDEKVFDLDELEIHNELIRLPDCLECGSQNYLPVNNIPDDEFDALPERNRQRNILNHTLCKKLIDRGKENTRNHGLNPKPTRAVEASAIEAPLHGEIIKAKKAREKAKNGQ